MPFFRADAIRFATRVIDNHIGKGASIGYDIDGIVEKLHDMVGSYDVTYVTQGTFWKIADAHEIEQVVEEAPAPAFTAEDIVIEAYRVYLRNILDSSFRDVLVDNEDITSEDEARAYVQGIAGSSWEITFVAGIAANISVGF